MPDITVDKQPYLYEVGTDEKEIALNPNRLYSVYHTGKDAAGDDSTVEVFAQCDGDPAEATYASKAGKIVIQPGGSFPLPPCTSIVKMKTAAGSAALQFVSSTKSLGYE